MKILYSDIERGLGPGIQACHALSKNWHDRIRLAKCAKALDKEFKEAMDVRTEMIQKYRNTDEGSVVPEKMEKAVADGWNKEIGEWRASMAEFDFNKYNLHPREDGKLEIKLGAVSLRSIPVQFMEAMIDYVEFGEDESQTKTEDSDAAIRKLQDELDKLKAKK